MARRLSVTRETLTPYEVDDALLGRLRADADLVRRGLTTAIGAIHPPRLADVGDLRAEWTLDALRTFENIFTLNYDLLMYWAQSRDWTAFKDGFGDVDGGLRHIAPQGQTLHYLHGAFHLFELDAGGVESVTGKLRWGGGEPILDQVRAALAGGRMPLIVTEGTATQKQERINRSGYLRDAQRRLGESVGDLMIMGWCIGMHDQHIVEAVARSSVSRLFLGVYGDPGNEANAAMFGRCTELCQLAGDGVPVELWYSATAPFWAGTVGV